MRIAHAIVVLFNCYRGPTPNGRFLRGSYTSAGTPRPELAQARLPIFEQFVVPALAAQSNQDFHLLILWDANLVLADVTARLVQIGDRVGQSCHLVPIAPIDFRSDYANAFWRARPEEQTVLAAVSSGADRLYITYLDSDDLLRDDAVAAIQAAAVTSDTQAVLLRRGYKLDSSRRRMFRYDASSPPFFTLTYDRAQYLSGRRHHGGKGRHLEVARR